ncbi:hypothetical protein ACGFSB_20200 [Streptomyces sp. NPDC048441]|uniref:hypothetical protein n=1 Tax=Streptomyces sp. NPDC048441 TaxID=3365552 RepID=UPI003711D847
MWTANVARTLPTTPAPTRIFIGAGGDPPSRRRRPREVKVPSGVGGHGGGDVRMLADLFGERAPGGADSLGRAADAGDGARSLATGLAANQSFVTGRPVDARDLMGT